MLIFIIIVLFWQLACYIALDKDNYPRVKWLVLALVLVGHVYAFPGAYIELFLPPSMCGMPVLGIMMGFWLFGALPACILHVVYCVV